MQAIRTKYVGPSNTRGSRVIASCEARRLIWGWDHSLGMEDNHAVAAAMLAGNLGWSGTWVGGTLPDGSRAFVNVQRGNNPNPNRTAPRVKVNTNGGIAHLSPYSGFDLILPE